MACVLIASKIEEELRPVSRIIKIFHSMYLHRTNQEIKDLEDTDSVIYIESLLSLGICLLEKDLNGNWKIDSFCIWISFLWYNRSSSQVCIILYQSKHHHFNSYSRNYILILWWLNVLGIFSMIGTISIFSLLIL